MKPVKLADFLGFLNGQSEKDFQGDSLKKYLSNHRLEKGALTPFIFFREDTYGRNLIVKTELYEMLVLTWLPKHRTPIHDHFGKRCWMLVDSGTLTFRNYEPIKHDDDELVTAGPCETHSSGQAVYIDDGIGVHSIANASARPAVSLHLYAGPIPRCRIYNEAAKSFEWRELTYFTRPDGGWEKLTLESEPPSV